jgi:hypothetical protein
MAIMHAERMCDEACETDLPTPARGRDDRDIISTGHLPRGRQTTMPAHDAFHDAVKNGLIKEGWTITHDPYPLEYGGKDLYVDLGAEKMIAAERGNQLIAAEIKSFIGPSVITDYHAAPGQFLNYRMA